MNCKEIRTATKKNITLPQALASEAADHIKGCAACHNALLLDRLTPAIIRAASATDYEASRANTSAQSSILINKIKIRIQELREQRASSWEMAVEATRGWLAAFALAAGILLAVSIQWKPPATHGDFESDNDESITQSSDEYLISDIPYPGRTGKDDPYADE